jgi:hypothetical protein
MRIFGSDQEVKGFQPFPAKFEISIPIAELLDIDINFAQRFNDKISK